MSKYGYYWRKDLTPEEVTLALEALERARSVFHGTSAALALAIDVEARLDLPAIQKSLHAHNKSISELLEKLSTGYGDKSNG